MGRAREGEGEGEGEGEERRVSEGWPNHLTQ